MRKPRAKADKGGRPVGMLTVPSNVPVAETKVSLCGNTRECVDSSLPVSTRHSQARDVRVCNGADAGNAPSQAVQWVHSIDRLVDRIVLVAAGVPLDDAVGDNHNHEEDKHRAEHRQHNDRRLGNVPGEECIRCGRRRAVGAYGPSEDLVLSMTYSDSSL